LSWSVLPVGLKGFETWPRAHRRAQLAERMTAEPGWKDGDFVWCQPNGRPIGARADWAGGTRTHDRRIMSPARQQPLSGSLTWADMDGRHHAQADLGTYLA